jgi:transposase-like protein
LVKQWQGPRIPESAAGIQVNFCKNPLCLNFGCPASIESQPRGPGAKDHNNRDDYTVISDGKGAVYLQCNLCNETLPIKNNSAILEECSRLSAYLAPNPEPSCPSDSCRNHTLGVIEPRAYQAFGTTSAGAKRYRCRACGKTFSVNTKPTARQRLVDKNEEIFRLLVNKVPLKRICELASVTMDTLYRKIDFIQRQCLSFAAAHESRLKDLPIRRLYLAVDRQSHVINWKHASEKCNIMLNAVGTADNLSGYVFGVHVNYDPTLDSAKIEQDAIQCGDVYLWPPFRRYARVWLAQDYLDSLRRSRGIKQTRGRLRDSIQGAYDNLAARDDIEASEMPTMETGLPYDGMQVHAEYTLYAHFLLLRGLLGHVEKIRFFLDQESGIRAACLATFSKEILEKRSDAFYVRCSKELTINQKRSLKAKSVQELADFRASSAAHEHLTDRDLRHLVIKDRLQELVDIGKWHDRWLFYPFPDMSEPEKAICWLTDLHDRSYDDDHLAWLYSKVTLHGIDRFFMQVRRRISLLERPITSSSIVGRKWYGYSPYNPAMVGKLLDIFRVFYNYVEVGDDKKTPAMRLGLTRLASYADVLGGG